MKYRSGTRTAMLLAAGLLIVAACGGDRSFGRSDEFEVVQEGSADGLSTTLQGGTAPPLQTPPMTNTNADTTTAFTTIDPNLGVGTTTDPYASAPPYSTAPYGTAPSYPSAGAAPPPSQSPVIRIEPTRPSTSSGEPPLRRRDEARPPAETTPAPRPAPPAPPAEQPRRETPPEPPPAPREEPPPVEPEEPPPPTRRDEAPREVPDDYVPPPTGVRR